MASVASRWHFLRALLIRIVALVGASLVVEAAFLSIVPAAVLRENSDPVGDYLQTLGTIYAVLQAFVVFVVWTQFNDARTLIEREANDILDLYRTTQALAKPHCDRLRQQLIAYVDCVLEREWDAMQRQDTKTLEATGSHLEEACGELLKFQPKDDRESVLFGEALSRFNELSDVRTERVTSGCSRMPLGLRLLLDGGIMVIGSTFLFYVPN